jgi:hypothetical protein
MKIMWYEDMKKDLISVIRDTANFLGKHLTDYRVLQLDDHLYIENFRQSFNAFNDPKMAKFIRKGKVGDWKNYNSLKKTCRFVMIGLLKTWKALI